MQDSYFRNTICVPRMPVSSSYGNAMVGLYQANSTLFEFINLWQVKFLSRDASGTTGALSQRAKALSAFALFDDCKGYAWISSMASYHNALTGTDSMRQVQAESHAMAVSNLKGRFDKYSMSLQLLATLNTLINAEFAAGDYDTAAHHTKFLADELDPSSCGISPLIIRSRHTVMIIELERAMATFSKPVFDISSWILHDQANEMFGSRGSGPTIILPASPPSDLDQEAISDARLNDSFTRLHHFDSIFRTLALGDVVTRGFAFQLSWSSLQLGNDILLHCLDLIDVASHSTPYKGEAFDSKASAHLSRCQQAATALACLYYFRLRVRCEQAGKLQAETALLEKFWSQGPRIARQMEKLLRISQSSADLLVQQQIKQRLVSSQTLEVHPAIRLRLWILYVGTWIEATAWYGRTKFSPYFSEALSDLQNSALGYLSMHARQCRLEQILSGFIVLEHVPGKNNSTHLALKQGPEWLSPALRTWGFANWDGDIVPS